MTELKDLGQELDFFWKDRGVFPFPRNTTDDDLFLPLSKNSILRGLQENFNIRLRGFFQDPQNLTLSREGVFRSWGRTYFIRPQDLETYWKNRRGDFRRDVFRRRKHLPAPEKSQDLGRLFDLHAGKFPLLRDPKNRERFENIFQKLMADGVGSLWAISEMAYVFVIETEHACFWVMPAYDPEQRKLGPGKVLLSYLVDHALRSGKWLYMGPGNDHDKVQWSESTMQFGDYYVGSWFFRNKAWIKSFIRSRLSSTQ